MSLTLPADFGNTPKTKLRVPEGMSKLLMQVCCAPCCGAVLECFKVHNVKATLFFYNPNIHPRDEYERRRDELIELAKMLGFDYIIPEYEPRAWFAKVKGLEREHERGARCSVCFCDRLLATALYAKAHGFTHFTSTLATSRWKNKKQVDAAGFLAQEATGVTYWSEDWRREGLVTRRYRLVKEFNFYNQTYCGCIYSRDNADSKLPNVAAAMKSVKYPHLADEINSKAPKKVNEAVEGSACPSCDCANSSESDCHC